MVLHRSPEKNTLKTKDELSSLSRLFIRLTNAEGMKLKFMSPKILKKTFAILKS